MVNILHGRKCCIYFKFSYHIIKIFHHIKPCVIDPVQLFECRCTVISHCHQHLGWLDPPHPQVLVNL